MKTRTKIFLNPQWIDILLVLCDAGPDGVLPSLLSEKLGVSAQNLSYYLKALEEGKVICKTPLGRNRVITVVSDSLREIREELDKLFEDLINMSEGKAQTHESTKNTVIRPSWDGKDIVHNDCGEQSPVP
jgi:predicted transcriptional regulator